MLEALLGPDIRCDFFGSAENLIVLRVALEEANGEVKSALDQQLMTNIHTCIEELLTTETHEHDGYLLSWELLCIDEFDDGLSLATSFNLSVKADDFDFFDGLLNNTDVLEKFLHRIQQTIREFLQRSGVPLADLDQRMESDGFGYG